MVVVFFDGACEPRNPGGHIGWGYVIYEGDKIIDEDFGYKAPSPQNTNNVAEYLGAIAGMNKLLELGKGHSQVLIKGDSNLVINQMKGEWKIKAGAYKKHALNAKRIVGTFPAIEFEHIPREQNEYADKLSKKPLIERGIKIPSRKIK